MASKNIFAYLDSDDEDVPKVNKKETAPPSGPVTLNKPAAGNKRTANKKAAAAAADFDKEKKAPKEGGAPRGERGPRRGGRGGRGGRRDFDRRSGTGRGKETSKQGGGSRNWGNEQDQTELVAEAEVQEGKAATEEEGAAQEPVVEEEEDNTMTLEEYMAKKKAERAGELFAEVEARKVEGDFSGAKILTKDGKTPDFMETQYEKVFNKKTSGRKKQVITDVGFRAAEPERERRYENRDRDNRDNRENRGRGGRGRDGGRDGGRGRGRGGRGRGPAIPNVADLSAFPSLK